MPRSTGVACLALLLTACATSPPRERSWSCSPRLHLSSVWTSLQAKYDADGDGVVSRSEYGRGDRQFDNYDRDENGSLDGRDFPADTFFNGFNHMIVMEADADADEQVTRAEWAAFGKRMNPRGRTAMGVEDVEPVLGDWAADWRLFLLSFDQDGDGLFTDTDMELTFRDQDFNGDGVLAGRETKGWQPALADRPAAPEPGSDAPAFTLPFAEKPTESFDLHRAVAERPVALVFGSYT